MKKNISAQEMPPSHNGRNEKELSAAELEKFNHAYGYMGSFNLATFSNNLFKWDEFLQEWDHRSSNASRVQELLEARKKGVEIRALGPDFQRFVEKKIIE